MSSSIDSDNDIEAVSAVRSTVATGPPGDPDGRGVTYAYLCGLASGSEYPSRRALELIASGDELRTQLGDSRNVL